ncbi:TetR family transcriptional regulator [Nocardia tenerifensis]|uniref:TetR family transcriptional regulator n=1 Tax=Nocardia tenerifensis TaxID=228006 RepID=A0A318JXH8_9NOCA|nr:TetR/AcrR family transcriptional regulator [Nocardia tenerifensis]PXX61678.1 TetR family transcriptional regulator [Nocardia tenerifensis]
MRSQAKILEATLEVIRNDGFEGVSIAAVAQQAGVSRQTVYSIFGSREDLVSQAIGDLLMWALAGIRAQLEAVGSASEYVVELIVAGRTAVRADPVLAALLRAGQGNPVYDTDMVARAKPIAHELLSPVLALDPNLAPHLDDIAQIGIRLGLSVILFDDAAIHSDDDLRGFLTRWLVLPAP